MRPAAPRRSVPATYERASARERSNTDAGVRPSAWAAEWQTLNWRDQNENGFRLRFSFWFFVFVDGFRFGSRWPLLADEPAEQGIDPTGAGCPCGRSVSGAAARDGSDIERGRGLADLTAGDRVDALLICAPRPAGSLRDVQASAAGSIESLLTDPGIGNTSLAHQRQQLPSSLICDELLVCNSRPVLH